jgi:hypothetical protein
MIVKSIEKRLSLKHFGLDLCLVRGMSLFLSSSAHGFLFLYRL